VRKKESKMEYQVEVGSKLYQAGFTEDGEAFIAESYFVAVEFSDGQRLQHQVTFPGASYEEDEDGFGYVDVREEAKAKAERLASAVRKSACINKEFWVEVDPSYGSQAYQSQGIEAQRAYLDRIAN